MDIANTIIFSATALMLRDRGVGIFCLLLISITYFFSNTGPLAFMTGQSFLVRHGIEEVVIAATALACIGINWRGLSIASLSLMTLAYYGYEYHMWNDYTFTFQYFETINLLLFELLVIFLWVNSPLRGWSWVQKIKLRGYT